ncbi:hypothetical protein IAT38_007784 [Cryptococcus sp. DSM 104549]
MSLTHQTTKETPIFPPFNFHKWRAVDDRVRGGSSVSHFDPVEIDMFGRVTPLASEGDLHDSAVASGAGKNKIGARFWGTLDIKTLGGAGFASQSYRYGPSPLHLPRTQYKGITLSILPDPLTTPPAAPRSTSPSSEKEKKPSSPTTFTFVLKTSPTAPIPRDPRVPPVPRASQLTYEANFTRPEGSLSGHQSTETTVKFKWEDFKASYRGREIKEGDPKWAPLDTNGVYEVSVMCRSGFGEQEGEYGVIVTGIAGWLKDEEKAIEEGYVQEGKQGWWAGVVGWFRWLMGWERGVRLDDSESVDEKRHLMV